jgi:hypothetical protein
MIGRRAARAVAACDLEPRGLPESAILIVRRLPDPAPRKLLTDRLHWERRARARLEELSEHAIRVAYQSTPDAAQAVWFEDQAEMTACLVADLAAGQAHRRWWWRIPLRQIRSVTPAARTVLTLLLREAHAIPEVVHLLETRRALGLVLQCLSRADVELIVRALEHTFAISSSTSGSQHAGEPAAQSTQRSLRVLSTDSVVSDATRPSAASGASSTGRSVARLLLLARALRHPAGSSSRAELLDRYRQAGDLADGPPAKAASGHAPALSPADSVEEETFATGTPARRTSTVETEWGGVLYLITVMKALDLPAAIHNGIGGWALLELMGRCLAGPASEDDGLWRAMATLDGREPGDPAGTFTRDPHLYRLPERWPCPATSVVYARARGHRLVLQHPFGFAVYDGPFTHAPHLGSYRRRRCRSQVPLQTTHALHRLLSVVVPYVAWWLREALGPGVEPRRILRIPGTIVISPTHVDAMFGLDSVSLPVRIAGLDANPGWMAALGRVITYHFQ